MTATDTRPLCSRIGWHPRGVVFVLLGILVGLWLTPPANATLAGNPEAGVFDLREWAVEEGGVWALDGEWLIRWRDVGVDEPFVVPGVWNGRELRGTTLDGSGYAVLRTAILLPDTDQPLALVIDNVKSAARVFVDGELVAERGRPAFEAGDEQPDLRALVIPLPVKPQVLLRLEISNHFHAEGGLDRSVVVARQSVVEAALAVERAWSLVAVGSLVGLAVYLLALGGWRRSTPAGWLFIALLLVSLVRFAAVSGLLDGLPGMNAYMVIRADYLSAFLFPGVYALLLRELFPVDLSRWLVWPIVGVSIVLAGTIVLPPATFTALRDFTALFVVASVILLLGAVARSAWLGRPGARLVLLGAALLAATAVNDALVAVRMLDHPDLIIPGALMFLILHGLVIGGRFFDAMDENVELGTRLARLNASLERQVAERTAALTREASLREDTLEAMAPAVLATTPSGDPQAWNQSFLEFFRLDPAVPEQFDRSRLALALRDSLGRTAPVDALVPAQPGWSHGRKQVQLPGGEVVELTAHRRADEGWVCSYIDVTARRVAEIGPQGGGVGTWEWNLQTGQFLGSARFWSTRGFDPRAIGDRRFDDFPALLEDVHPEDQPRAREALEAAFAGADTLDEELRIQSQSGAWLWVVFRARVIRDAAGEPRRLVGVQSDIHAVVTARVALEDARDEAEQDASEKGRMLAVLSHETRTPLHGILGQLDLIGRADGVPTPIRERLLIIRQTAQEMVVLLEDILAMSGLEAGRQPVRNEPFRPRDLMQHMVAMVEPRARAWGLEVAASVSDSVPEELRGDHTKLRQILLNLLDNAVKFTKKGSVGVHMERCAEGRYRLTVTDTGPGLEPGAAARMFEAFTHSPESRGSGLGLFIVARLARMLGGEVRVVSEPPAGARFTVELPLEACGATPRDEPSESVARNRPTDLRVLLVEDVAINRLTVSEILESEGHRVCMTSSAQEALEVIERDAEWNIVLLDLRLPDLDGVEAVRMLRDRGLLRDVPVVAFTADVTVGRRDAFITAGGSAVLEKPLDLNAFYEVLDSNSPSAHQDGPETPCTMQGRLVEFEERLGLDTTRRLVGLLRSSLGRARSELEEAASQSDWVQCREIAHRLCGSAANYGLSELEAVAQRVDTGPEAWMSGDLSILQDVLAAAIEALDEHSNQDV